VGNSISLPQQPMCGVAVATRAGDQHPPQIHRGRATSTADLREFAGSRIPGEVPLQPGGRPSYKPVVWYKNFLYQAASWKAAQRVVAKAEFHFGELLPGWDFLPPLWRRVLERLTART
jgi:hypothetical protein